MKERFKRLPEALQKQVIYRLGAGVIFFTVYNFDIDFFSGISIFCCRPCVLLSSLF